MRAYSAGNWSGGTIESTQKLITNLSCTHHGVTEEANDVVRRRRKHRH
jgi:hypothetical protein